MKLSAQEREELIKLEKQIPHKGVAIRIRIILALDLGYTAKEVGEILLLNEDTINKWKRLYEGSQYLSDWLGDKNNGYQGKLTKEQERIVDKFVKEAVITDCQQVAEYIQNMFGITYTLDGVSKLLHRLRFVYKQVVAIPGKLNERAQEEFLQSYQNLKENKPKDEVILFGDGVHPTHNAHKTKAWIAQGEEKQVKTNTGRGRLNINGVLDPETLEVTTVFAKTINAQTTIELLDKIQKVYEEKKTIHLIIDNARYYKNKEVTDYLNNPTCRIHPIFLPSYSPNLNFIERLWKFMKKYIIGVKYREKFKQFEEDIREFLDNIHLYKERLRSFIGSKLHLVKLNPCMPKTNF